MNVYSIGSRITEQDGTGLRYVAPVFAPANALCGIDGETYVLKADHYVVDPDGDAVAYKGVAVGRFWYMLNI